MRFQYRTIEFGKLDIHLRTLRDTNEFDDPGQAAEALGISPAMWPLFGVVWTSSIVLAAMMVDIDIVGRRILEVGCGIGLPSMVLHHRGADITASDRHPEAQAFLDENAALNELGAMPFVRADWSKEDAELGRFDLIIGSDLLHDRGHAELLSSFIDKHASARNDVVLIDPGRGQAGKFARQMQERGFTYDKHRAIDDTSLDLAEEVSPRIQVHCFHQGPALG